MEIERMRKVRVTVEFDTWLNVREMAHRAREMFEDEGYEVTRALAEPLDNGDLKQARSKKK